MITEVLIPIVAVIIALLLIPVIYYYCIGMFDGMKGHLHTKHRHLLLWTEQHPDGNVISQIANHTTKKGRQEKEPSIINPC